MVLACAEEKALKRSFILQKYGQNQITAFCNSFSKIKQLIDLVTVHIQAKNKGMLMTHDAVVLCAVHAILSGFLGPFIFSVTCSVFSNFGVKNTLYTIHAWELFCDVESKLDFFSIHLKFLLAGSIFVLLQEIFHNLTILCIGELCAKDQSKLKNYSHNSDLTFPS